MSSKITLKNIENVLAFFTLFTDTDAKLYDIQTEPLTLDPYCYSKEFHKFITSVYQENFVIDFDWIAWQYEAHRLVTNPELLIVADISTLQKLLTTHVRKERFCGGHLAAMIDHGHFFAIFDRLQAIHAALMLENADKNGEPNMMKQMSVFQGDITQPELSAGNRYL